MEKTQLELKTNFFDLKHQLTSGDIAKNIAEYSQNMRILDTEFFKLSALDQFEITMQILASYEQICAYLSNQDRLTLDGQIISYGIKNSKMIESVYSFARLEHTKFNNLRIDTPIQAKSKGVSHLKYHLKSNHSDVSSIFAVNKEEAYNIILSENNLFLAHFYSTSYDLSFIIYFDKNNNELRVAYIHESDLGTNWKDFANENQKYLFSNKRIERNNTGKLNVLRSALNNSYQKIGDKYFYEYLHQLAPDIDQLKQLISELEDDYKTKLFKHLIGKQLIELNKLYINDSIDIITLIAKEAGDAEQQFQRAKLFLQGYQFEAEDLSDAIDEVTQIVDERRAVNHIINVETYRTTPIVGYLYEELETNHPKAKAILYWKQDNKYPYVVFVEKGYVYDDLLEKYKVISVN